MRTALRRPTALLAAVAAVLGGLVLAAPSASAEPVCADGYTRRPNPTVLVPHAYPPLFPQYDIRDKALAVRDDGVPVRILPPAAGGDSDRVSVWAAGSSCAFGSLEQGGWSVTARGVVQTWNFNSQLPQAQHLGDLAGVRLNAPLSGMAVAPRATGYWLLGRDGGVFTYGDARFYGSTGGLRLNAPVIGMAATPTGAGYWLFAADGGIFTYGDARFYGSTGGLRLQEPVVGMSPTPSGRGYRLVASDGGVFTYGDATFQGSAAGGPLPAPVAGIITRPTGYSLVGQDSSVYTF